MNILTFESEENQSGLIRLSDYRAKHMKEIIKVSVGQEIKIGEIGGLLGTAVVEQVDETGISIRVNSTEAGPKVLDLDLLIALPRPQTIKKVLELAGCFSVKSITFVGSSKVENNYFQSSAINPENIKKHLVLGLQQGVKTYLPKVYIEKDFAEVLEEVSKNYLGKKLVADASAKQSIKEINLQSCSTLLAIGPEAGWTEPELSFFAELGFLKINLSKAILRVENAVCCALGQFELVVDGVN